MTYFYQDEFSSSEVAGAVAEAAIYDLRVNKSPLHGFPQIHISDPVDDVFSITLSWSAACECKASFELTRAEAKQTATIFKRNKGYDRVIFNRVQSALQELEDKLSQDSQRRDRTPMSEPA